MTKQLATSLSREEVISSVREKQATVFDSYKTEAIEQATKLVENFRKIMFSRNDFQIDFSIKYDEGSYKEHPEEIMFSIDGFDFKLVYDYKQSWLRDSYRWYVKRKKKTWYGSQWVQFSRSTFVALAEKGII
jgi:hypothetical protein